MEKKVWETGLEEITRIANATTAIPPDQPSQISAVWGYLAVAISGFCFGSASLPIKKYEAGDGVVFQLASSLALWSVGLLVHSIRSFPKFYFLPMVGGFLFASANVKMVPILKTIGIGMGTSIRASIGIVVGWVSARYGIFGTTPEYPNNLIENYLGVVLSVIGALLFLFVKPSVNNLSDPTTAENQHLISNATQDLHYQTIDFKNNEIDEGKLYLANLTPLKKRILGVSLSITAGMAVGLAYVPYLYVVDRFDNVSKNGLDYIFSMFTGDLISVFTYFIFYCLLKKNRPYVNRQAILPGCVNGWIWGIGACCFQFANSVLSQAVTFPIALGLQSLMGVVYGVFLFKEICGITNFIILSMGFIATVIGSALCGISKY